MPGGMSRRRPRATSCWSTVTPTKMARSPSNAVRCAPTARSAFCASGRPAEPKKHSTT
jgi:hypothetical protein